MNRNRRKRENFRFHLDLILNRSTHCRFVQSSTKENQTNEPAEDVTIGPNGERLYEVDSNCEENSSLSSL